MDTSLEQRMEKFFNFAPCNIQSQQLVIYANTKPTFSPNPKLRRGTTP
jgi:hypothetical protein